MTDTAWKRPGTIVVWTRQTNRLMLPSEETPWYVDGPDGRLGTFDDFREALAFARIERARTGVELRQVDCMGVERTVSP